MKRYVISIILVGCLLFTFTLAGSAGPSGDGEIIYVTPDGTGNGTSWSNAFGTISDAVAAAVSEDHIYVKAGTYNITAQITLKSGVSIFGGFAGNETDESERIRSDKDGNGIVEAWEFANETIIQSNGTAKIFHGPVSAALTVVDGFTLTGAGNTSNGSVAALNKNVQMFNCTVKNNPNGGRGLIYVDGGGLFHSYIYNNKGAATPSDRGTIYVYYNNGAPATIAYCKIEGNKAQYGGAIYSRSSSETSIINNLIIDNEATIRGGGVYIGSGSAPPANGHLVNNTIMGNTVSSTTVVPGDNGDGSGLYAEGGTYAYNNIIALNTGSAGCQQVACSDKAGAFVFKNNALGNLDDIVWLTTGSPTPRTTLENNINVEETAILFDAGSYLPASGSILINAGNKTLFPDYTVDSTTLFDLAGNTRVQNGQIDIGAYERTVITDPQIVLESDTVAFDGTPKTLTATTTPEGLPVSYLYDGSETAPSAVGEYEVKAIVSCTVDDIQYEGEATATLTISNEYTVIITAGEGGSASPSGEVSVFEGDSLNIEFTPEEGYRVSKILVDDEEVTVADSYEFTDITGDHTLEVTFELIPIPSYTITVTAGEGGSASPSGEVSVLEGDSLKIEFTPEKGYRVSKILVDGEEVTAADSYEFTDITGDHALEVTFELIPVTDEDKSPTPDTGDTPNISIYMLILLISISAVMVIFLLRKKALER